MVTTISATNGAGSWAPATVLGWQARRESRNKIDDLIGGGIAVALIAPRPRAGALEMLFPVEADAWEAVALHAEESSFILVDTDRPALGMTYTVGTGSVQAELRMDTDTWVVTVPYQEVEP